MLRRVQQRLHHLDALRAAAMLLGIVLHASLAYTGGPWMVRDEGHWTFAVANFAIHGFRMPLFFLLSGFFTALLWKRHGIGGMLRNRAARIALPLAIALFTIVPLIWIVAIVAGAEQGGEDAPPAGDGAAPPHPRPVEGRRPASRRSPGLEPRGPSGRTTCVACEALQRSGRRITAASGGNVRRMRNG
jgi:hypothetical protein